MKSIGSLALLLPALLLGQNRSQEIHKLFSDYYEAQLKETPEFATREGRSEYNHLLKDWSKPALERQHREFESYLSRLKQVSLAGLSEQDQVSVRLLRYQLQQIIEGERTHRPSFGPRPRVAPRGLSQVQDSALSESGRITLT